MWSKEHKGISPFFLSILLPLASRSRSKLRTCMQVKKTSRGPGRRNLGSKIVWGDTIEKKVLKKRISKHFIWTLWLTPELSGRYDPKHYTNKLWELMHEEDCTQASDWPPWSTHAGESWITLGRLRKVYWHLNHSPHKLYQKLQPAPESIAY